MSFTLPKQVKIPVKISGEVVRRLGKGQKDLNYRIEVVHLVTHEVSGVGEREPKPTI